MPDITVLKANLRDLVAAYKRGEVQRPDTTTWDAAAPAPREITTRTDTIKPPDARGQARAEKLSAIIDGEYHNTHELLGEVIKFWREIRHPSSVPGAGFFERFHSSTNLRDSLTVFLANQALKTYEISSEEFLNTSFYSEGKYCYNEARVDRGALDSVLAQKLKEYGVELDTFAASTPR